MAAADPGGVRNWGWVLLGGLVLVALRRKPPPPPESTLPIIRPFLLQAADTPFPPGAEAVVESYWNTGINWTERTAGIKLRVVRTVPPRFTVPFMASDLSNMLSGRADSQRLYDWMWANTPLNRNGVEQAWVMFWWGWHLGSQTGPVSSGPGYSPRTMTSVSFIGDWGTISWMLAAGLPTPGRPSPILTVASNVGLFLHELYHSLSASFEHPTDGIMSVDWIKWPNVGIDPVTLERLRASPYRIPS